TTPIAASATGNSTKTGRLNVVSASATPSSAKPAAVGLPNSRSASHIEIVNSSVVQTSVITSGTKYASGGNSAVAAAAATAIWRSRVVRRAIARTQAQMIMYSPVCASAIAA